MLSLPSQKVPKSEFISHTNRKRRKLALSTFNQQLSVSSYQSAVAFKALECSHCTLNWYSTRFKEPPRILVTITKLRALLISNLDTLPGSERIKQDKHFRKVRVSHRNLLTAGNDRRHPTEPTLFHSRKQIRCPYLK